jgi:hypothetical protein
MRIYTAGPPKHKAGISAVVEVASPRPGGPVAWIMTGLGYWRPIYRPAVSS